MKDWRKDYCICEHVAESESIEARHSGFEVCCVPCYDQGFLFAELETKEVNGLCIGKIKGEKRNENNTAEKNNPQGST